MLRKILKVLGNKDHGAKRESWQYDDKEVIN